MGSFESRTATTSERLSATSTQAPPLELLRLLLRQRAFVSSSMIAISGVMVWLHNAQLADDIPAGEAGCLARCSPFVTSLLANRARLICAGGRPPGSP